MGPLILTNIGLAKLASATPENQIEIKSVAVGDSDAPIDPTNTALNNEVWRGDSSLPIRDPMDAKVLIFEGAIPASVGGFTIREVGLFDVDGDLIAIGHTSEIDKPAPSAGTPITLTARVRLTLENASQTDLIIADAPLIDHQGTSNRDASDAHPISSITGLRGELDAKANTADLGTAAYEDVVSDEDDTTPGQLITTEWRGLNFTKRWQISPPTGPWQKFATVWGNSFDYHGVFFIDQLSRDPDGPRSARIEFNGDPSPGSFHARSFVSDRSNFGFAAYHHLGDGTFDLYVNLDNNIDPVVEFTGSPNTLINIDSIDATLPSGAVIVPRAVDWNSVSMSQTWQDMTASRALGTTYTNNTGRPIHVSVVANPDSGAVAPFIGLHVDGVPIAQSKASATSGQVYLNVYSIVPAGSTYTVNTSTESSAAAVIRYWREYR